MSGGPRKRLLMRESEKVCPLKLIKLSKGDSDKGLGTIAKWGDTETLESRLTRMRS